ncbi:MAG: molybdopterin molybdotransferase MoeA [Chrysiogenetes bacterium]|nr:molybdopterin molybdotransferase MoeA [Chrysiogenetes bacterium]
MRPAHKALDIILKDLPAMGTERVQLLDAAGRVLAEPIASSRTLPPRDCSAMDGYAVRAADLAGASKESPATLKVVGEVLAGMLPERAVGQGEAVRITTGAPVPEGADAVVIQENTERESETALRVFSAEVAGANIRRAGEDVKPGEGVLEPGCVLGPRQLGLLALLGRSVVQVRRRPRVAILSSGDELVGIDGDTEGWKTVDSNAYTAAAQVVEAGGEPMLLPLVPDDKEAIVAALRSAAGADVLVSTAGVSVGPHDFVKPALEELGYEQKFWKIRQRPGAPLAFGYWDHRPVFGLPGNPVSAAVSFEVYVRPALKTMLGHQCLFRPVVEARLRGEVRTRSSHTFFLRALLSRGADGQWEVSSSGLQSSGAVKPLAQGNALIVVPEGRETPVDGEPVRVLVLDPEALELDAAGARRFLGA